MPPTSSRTRTLAAQVAAALGGQDAGLTEVPGSGGLLVSCRALSFAAGSPETLPRGTPRTYSRKGLVDLNGTSLFAELAVVRLFTSAGWDAFWWNGFHRAWVADGDMSRAPHLTGPMAATSLLDKVSAIRRGKSGCWDVVACRDGQVVFAECKHKGADRLTQTQGAWLRACVDIGVPLEAFVVVEWSLSRDEPSSSA